MCVNSEQESASFTLVVVVVVYRAKRGVIDRGEMSDMEISSLHLIRLV